MSYAIIEIGNPVHQTVILDAVKPELASPPPTHAPSLYSSFYIIWIIKNHTSYPVVAVFVELKTIATCLDTVSQWAKLKGFHPPSSTLVLKILKGDYVE